MNINIFRRRFTPWSVDGTMLIGGKIFCDTLERPGHCLPAGRYKISLIPVRQMKEVEKKKKKNYERGKYEIVIKPVIQFRLATVPRSPGHDLASCQAMVRFACDIRVSFWASPVIRES